MEPVEQVPQRKRRELPVPEYLRSYFAETVPFIERGESQTPDDEDTNQYPFEGDSIYGHEDTAPGIYKFTYHADEEGYRGSLYLRLTLDDMRAIAAGEQRNLVLWKCVDEECDRWVQDPMERCLSCEQRRAEVARKAAEPPKVASSASPRTYPPRVEIAGPPAEFSGELKAFNLVGCPTIANLLGMSREEAERTLLARSDDGRMVREFVFLDHKNLVSAGYTRWRLRYAKGRVTPGGIAWDVATFLASWGSQNRIGYAPERPIRRVMEYRLRRVSYDGVSWQTHVLNAEETEKAILYNASSNRSW